MHADESCLGNQNEGPSKGGAASLIEIRVNGDIVRRDLFLHSEDTTNNRMAIQGATETLRALSKKERRLRVFYVSDSQYLVKGMNEWIWVWKKRGWKRKGGAIENLALWQELDIASREHEVRWHWVRGHADHPKNEYANDMAINAATQQVTSDGIVETEFPSWLEKRQSKNKYLSYDPEEDFASYEARAIQ